MVTRPALHLSAWHAHHHHLPPDPAITQLPSSTRQSGKHLNLCLITFPLHRALHRLLSFSSTPLFRVPLTGSRSTQGTKPRQGVRLETRAAPPRKHLPPRRRSL